MGPPRQRIDVGLALALARRPRDCPDCKLELNVSVLAVRLKDGVTERRLRCAACRTGWWQHIID